MRSSLHRHRYRIRIRTTRSTPSLLANRLVRSGLTLEWQQQRLGQDHPALICSLYTHAFALLAAHRVDESERLLGRVLNIQRIYRGLAHPATASVFAALARVKASKRLWAESEELLQRAFDIRQSTYSQYHIRTCQRCIVSVVCLSVRV